MMSTYLRSRLLIFTAVFFGSFEVSNFNNSNLHIGDSLIWELMWEQKTQFRTFKKGIRPIKERFASPKRRKMQFVYFMSLVPTATIIKTEIPLDESVGMGSVSKCLYPEQQKFKFIATQFKKRLFGWQNGRKSTFRLERPQRSTTRLTPSKCDVRTYPVQTTGLPRT